MFINIQNGKALDVSGGKDAEGQAVFAWRKHGGINQKWSVRYLDKGGKTGKDEYSKEFGFEHGRAFYFVSRLPMQRVIEWPGGGNIRIQNWVANKKSQQFWWDGVSKTIRSNNWKNYAMNIQSNGGSKDVSLVSSINSRWW